MVKLDPHKAARRSAEVRRAKAEARRETIRDKLARKLEEHADEVVAAYLAGIRSDDAHQAYKAAEAWLSRVHGRPTQTIETPPEEGFPEVYALSRESRQTLLRSLTAEHPNIAAELGIEVALDDSPNTTDRVDD